LIAFVYFDYQIQASQTAYSVLSSLLRQLVAAFEQVPLSVSESFKKHETPTLDEIVRLLHLLLLESSNVVYIVVDALDECNTQERRRFLDAIKPLAKMDSVRLFVTARPHVEDIRRAFDNQPVMEIKATDNDLRLYLHRELSLEGIYTAIDESFAQHIIETLINRAHGL